MFIAHRGRPAALFLLTIVGLGVANASEADSALPSTGDEGVQTRLYAGTRELRHEVDVTAPDSGEVDYHGSFDVEASRTSKRAGDNLLETETRFFTVRSGGYRADAAMREVIVRDERVAGADLDVTLEQYELDRGTFGYLAPPPMPAHEIRGHAPFDGVDREWTVETYETPPLVYTARPGTHVNAAARSVNTSILNEFGDSSPGTISEQVASDGSVQSQRQQFTVEASFEQGADGSGHSNSSVPGFYNVDLAIAPAALSPSRGGYAIAITSKSTGRTVGPNPVVTATQTIPDWYPGGTTLPTDTDVVTASGRDDTSVPAACGAASGERLAHHVIDRRTWTRITGITEADSDETYWIGPVPVCYIERRHTEHYDLTSGKRSTTDDSTTTLGITRL